MEDGDNNLVLVNQTEGVTSGKYRETLEDITLASP